MRFQVESNSIRALIHLLKIVLLLDDQATRLDTARDRYSPSMGRLLDGNALWREAVRRLRRDTATDGQPPPHLPETCPFMLDQLLDESAEIPALVAMSRG